MTPTDALAAALAAPTAVAVPLPAGQIECPACDGDGEHYWNPSIDPAQERSTTCTVCAGQGHTTQANATAFDEWAAEADYWGDAH